MRRLSEYIHIYATWPWIHPYAFKYAISTLVCFPERGFRPVTNFMRNLSALSSWYSVYTSAIAFIVSPRQPFRYSTIKLVIGTFSCYQLIGVVCGSITGLHVCSLEWLDHPYVPVPRAPPSLLELPHCQVIIPSLIVQSHWSSTLSELLLNHQPWHSHKHLLGSHWRLPVCVPMIHRSQGLEDSVEHRTWSLWARGEDLNLWSWGAQAGAKFKDSCWCLGLWRIQEPPKEDLTVSEKFQLVLDVAQRAQVRHGGQAEVYWQCLFDIWPRLWQIYTTAAFNFPPQNLFGKLANILEKIRKWVCLRTHTFLECWLWCLLNSACLCGQFVHVGSAWADSKAVCGTVGGLYLLLPAAIQTAGLHHRYIRYSP